MYNRASKCDIRFKLILVSDGGRLKELTFSLVCVFNGLAHHFHLLSFTAFSSFLNKKKYIFDGKNKSYPFNIFITANIFKWKLPFPNQSKKLVQVRKLTKITARQRFQISEELQHLITSIFLNRFLRLSLFPSIIEFMLAALSSYSILYWPPYRQVRKDVKSPQLSSYST